MWRILAAIVLLAAAPVMARTPRTAPAQQTAAAGRNRPAATTDEVFRRHGRAVVQVRIVDRTTQEKSTIGSGVKVSPHGHIITNYHVVSQLVLEPEDHQAELVDEDTTTVALRLLNIDVVHDLAILQAAQEFDDVLTLSSAPISKGTRIYALGNPLDLGLSIVEGNYNGLLAESLYEKIHFSGALNPGMSGGPAITADGRIIGINVSTAGNEVSFLVPAAYAEQLMQSTLAADYQPSDRFTEQIGTQLLHNQAALVERLLRDSFEPVVLANYELPGLRGDLFKCWGNRHRDDDKRYDIVSHTCSIQDRIYVDEHISAGSLEIQHELIRSDVLNRFQFTALVESKFNRRCDVCFVAERDFTPFECHSRFIDQGDTSLRVAMCVRSYKKFPGLYDAIVRAVSLDSNSAAIVTELTLTGVSFDSATALAQRYLEGIRWKKL